MRDGLRRTYRGGEHRLHRPGDIDFDWNGSDEGDPGQRTSWADIRDDGHLEGEIAYGNGDETTFIAKPWPFSAAC